MNVKELGLVIQPITPIQRQYLNDTQHRFFVVAAGRRSRKTIIGMDKVFFTAIENANKKYFLAAPTRDQAKHIFWDKLKKMSTKLHILGDKNEVGLQCYLKNDTIIRVVGLDRPERMEGETPSWNGGMITETPDIKQEGWFANVRPTLSDTNGFCILDGVPDYRHQWYLELAQYACGGQIPETRPFIGAFAENPNDTEWCFYSWFSSDVLDEKEIESAKRQLDARIYRQEYEGSFERSGGLVYYAYTTQNHSTSEFTNGLPTIITFDFNVNPMSALICQEASRDVWHTVSEFNIPNSNTFETVARIRDYLNNRGYTNSHGLYVTGDYSGNQRRSSSSATDWLIIKDGLKEFGPTYKYRATPAVKDRVNAINGMFRNAINEIKMYVNPKNCPILHKELNMQVWKKDGDLETMNDSIGHKTDALSYLAMNFYPIRGESKLEYL